MLLKVLTLITQVHQKNILFVTITIFKTKELSFSHMSTMVFLVQIFEPGHKKQ